MLDEPADLPEGTKVRCVVIVEGEDAQARDSRKPSHAGLLKFAGVIKDSPPDAAKNLDHYLYGHSRE
jgi:predicted DNA-binding antitoxin AbrB/MazE fold protein